MDFFGYEKVANYRKIPNEFETIEESRHQVEQEFNPIMTKSGFDKNRKDAYPIPWGYININLEYLAKENNVIHCPETFCKSINLSNNMEENYNSSYSFENTVTFNFKTKKKVKIRQQKFLIPKVNRKKRKCISFGEPGNTFNLVHKIGRGSFGDVYMGKRNSDGKQFACKLEFVKCSDPRLEHEKKLYKRLAGGRHIPSIRWFGKVQDYSILVMDWLGCNLKDLSENGKNILTLRTVLLLIDQMLSALEFIHSRHIIHRDIKPENFVLGSYDKNKIYLIDFGLSKEYIDRKTGYHIPYGTKKTFVGTRTYSSIYSQLGVEQSRRDDMEALGHLMIYLLKGFLPWQNVFNWMTKEQQHFKVIEMKISTSLQDLTAGLPPQFYCYMFYCRTLGFYDAPNYCGLKEMFESLFFSLNYSYRECLFL